VLPYHFDTLQIHAGQTPDKETKSRAVPIYQTTSYCYDSAEHAAAVFAGQAEGFTYTRIVNPTVAALEGRMAAIERGKAAVAFSSGMAAISAALFALCSHGDHIVAQAALYGGTYTLLKARLPQMGAIATTFVDIDDLAALENAIQENTRIIYLETMSNPYMSIPDFDGIKAIARKHGVVIMLDNTFAIPPIFDAQKHGADIVVHSLSKYAGGHGTTIGGAVVDMGNFDYRRSGRYAFLAAPDPYNHGIVYADQPAPVAVRLRQQFIRELGACLSPFDAFLFLQGLETLSLRVKRHSVNALHVAKFLQEHPAVEYVRFPMLKEDPYHDRALKYFDMDAGAGAILSFGVRGGLAAGRRFINALRLFSLLANVADAKSLVIHPASTTHGQLSEAELLEAGVAPGLIRLSVGLEDEKDLVGDLDQALRASQAE